MRLIDAEGSELQTQLKIIREAEYQIYGSGSWGFTTKCEHAIEDAPTIQPEPHWIPVTERLPEESGQYLITVKYEHVDGYEDIYAEHGDWSDGKWDMFGFGHCGKVEDIVAWMPLPEPYKGVTE